MRKRLFVKLDVDVNIILKLILKKLEGVNWNCCLYRNSCLAFDVLLTVCVSQYDLSK